MHLAEPDRATFVELNRTRLRLWHWGDPFAPPVLMVHGAFDHGRMFDGLAPRVAALGFHAIAVDARGHGDSGRLHSGNAWLAVNLDLVMLARHLGGEVRFVSHSFGGGQSLAVASGFPELVRWVVSIDGLGPPAAAFEPPDFVADTTRALDAMERLWTHGPRVHESRQDMAERRRKINFRMPEEWAAHLVEHGSVAVDGGFRWKFDPMFNVDMGGSFTPDVLLEEYRQIRCPVLLVTGSEHDTWNDNTPNERDERLAQMADGRHVEIDGVGHYPHLEDLDALMDVVTPFIREVEG